MNYRKQMKRMLVLVSVSIIGMLLIPSSVFGYPWPFDPFNQQHKIRQTLGAYREGGYFHEGVDIV